MQQSHSPYLAGKWSGVNCIISFEYRRVHGHIEEVHSYMYFCGSVCTRQIWD